MNDQFPEEFERTDSATKAGSDSTDLVPTGEQTFIRIGHDELQDLGAIGMRLQGAALLRVSRDRAMLLQQRLNTVMKVLAGAVLELDAKPRKTQRDLRSMAQLSHSLGHLSARMTDSLNFVLEVNASPLAEEMDGETRNRSFVPGQIVVPAPAERLVMARKVQNDDSEDPNSDD